MTAKKPKFVRCPRCHVRMAVVNLRLHKRSDCDANIKYRHTGPDCPWCRKYPGI